MTSASRTGASLAASSTRLWIWTPSDGTSIADGWSSTSVDVNRLDDQVLAYGRSNAQGEVVLKQPVPVPGTYTLMVVAKGYEPMIGEGELTLEADTPAVYDPWGKLSLRAR